MQFFCFAYACYSACGCVYWVLPMNFIGVTKEFLKLLDETKQQSQRKSGITRPPLWSLDRDKFCVVFDIICEHEFLLLCKKQMPEQMTYQLKSAKGSGGRPNLRWHSWLSCTKTSQTKKNFGLKCYGLPCNACF